jgi:2-polyprenyl-6-methoxyphenol hydroxylase-like FAD-dependent oxidoreductase
MKKIVIVGGGPIGLFAGIMLNQAGFDCTILEKRLEPVPDSRSLGIHPVSLKYLDDIGVLNAFLTEGIKIYNGHAYTSDKKLGSISFAKLAEPYNYILACPQSKTETLLRAHINHINPNALLTGARVTNMTSHKQSCHISYTRDNMDYIIEADYLLVCDGKNSFCRDTLGIPFNGHSYPDTYIMGDFEDNTPFGDDAVVYLPSEGMIECFPLPNKMRRWVVKTPKLIKKPSPSDLTKLVKKRLNIELNGLQLNMLSSFGVQHYVASKFVHHRCILLGDAAHIVSPIGGQGMNLGWMGAFRVANILTSTQADSIPEQLDRFETSFRKIVKKAARNAEINMKLGRKQRLPLLRNFAIQTILKSPLRKMAAKQFTMLSLER